ncbi:bifunctional phosphatase PAP2/diacylglycerol kinase family protein [Amycolatopsis pigmentata]|uniref:Bifunctional phosphatase PAP2/diacylglycerol kinase family protein n=1 Tax=Amycolatopsis pigmentata TaxID=450801 RepID=A0ABW5FYH4_9PSEU
MWRRIPAMDRWVLTKMGTRDPKIIRYLPLLGRSANYNRLWWGISALLAVTGDKRARRAGLRGIIAAVVASFAANILAKQAVRRPRPPIDLTPIHRRLRRFPQTTSFPSGHSASAAAFAAGVAIEFPVLAAPIGVIAAGVAASRVVTGVHYPSDVVAGSALGVGAGVLTLWWWPRTTPGPAMVENVPGPALADGEGLVVIVNSAAGSAGEDLCEVLERRLPKAELIEHPGDADLADVLAAAARRCRVLGVAGGDGSINVAARIAVEHDVPLLAIPAGTLNHFAKDLGVGNADEAIDALQAGETVRVDLGRVDGQVFVNTCSTGLYTDMVRYREKWERRLGKWPAVLVGLVHVTRRAKPQELMIDGRPRRVWMVFAGNGRYEPTGFAPSSRPQLDDGLLDVRIVDAERPLARSRIVWALLTGTLPWCGPYEGGTATEVKISAPDGLLHVTVDGEFTEVNPQMTITKEPRALAVYRPRRG